ncbi:MAG TPA: hydrogenase maturation protease [Solirubrobacteraceae bacterium]|nr:hydrogenase maturation protease [Solirubrobacteraceae bacterium]
MGDEVLVVGVGNALRGDDGAGLEVVRRLRARAGSAGVGVRLLEGEGIGLLEAWEGARAVVLVDSVRTNARAGAIHRIDVTDSPLPAALRSSSSTHAVGVGEAIELARALGRLPSRLVVYGVEGGRFETGAALSPEVAAVVDGVADAVLREARRLARAARGHAT